MVFVGSKAKLYFPPKSEEQSEWIWIRGQPSLPNGMHGRGFSIMMLALQREILIYSKETKSDDYANVQIDIMCMSFSRYFNNHVASKLFRNPEK